jgi:deoxyribose-phosphate aldolase
MTRAELARMIDHSVLKPESTGARHRRGRGRDVRAWKLNYYCVQPCWVALAARLLDGTGAT